MVTGEDILGSWIMTGRGTDDDTDQALARLRYGDDSQGFMIFAPDGWMNAIVCWGGRPPLPGNPAWHSDAPIDDKIKAFDTYLSYGGQWTVTDSTLTTRVCYALNPGWVGGDQVRGLEMAPDGTLTLTLSRAWPDGRMMRGWVQWRKAASASPHGN